MAAAMLRQIPNLLSLLRVALVAPILAAAAADRYEEALLWFLLAAVTDGLDGFLARRFGWSSRLGGFLDPAADKLLLVSSYLLLAHKGWIPMWLAALVVGRDLVIVLGSILFRILVGRFEAAPSLISKTNTVAQIVLVVMVIVVRIHPGALPASMLGAAMVVVTATTVASGVGYVWVWGRRALRLRRRPEAGAR